MSLFDEALIDQINRILQPAAPPPTTADREREQRRTTAVTSSVLKRMKVDQDRIGRVKEARERYETDSRVEGIIQTLARDVTKGGFELNVADARAAEAAQELRERLKLDSRLDDWVRLTLRDGDTFLELGVSAERLIEIVTRKPTLKMHRNSDRSDRFPDPRRAYWYDDRLYALEPSPDAIWFAEWQIVHARWAHDEGQRYGRPLMHSGASAWKRIHEGEIDVAVRRKVRAGVRYHHIIDGDEGAIEAYKERNQPALDNPLAAVLDFYSNGAKIEVLQGDANVGNIDDIIHHIETWWIGSPVPRALLGYGRDLNRDVLREQKRQYDETLDSIRDWTAKSFIVPLLEMQWLLAGIVPDGLEYEVAWPIKAIVTPEDILRIAQAAQVLRGLGISENVIALILARFLPGVDPQMLAEEMVNTSPEAERLAQIARQLSRELSR